MRGWRNRQTRTFEGRVGNRAGSSPASRTICRCGGMADALASGASVRKDVRVQVPPSAPKTLTKVKVFLLYLDICTIGGVT